jgi:hypothetical protein
VCYPGKVARTLTRIGALIVALASTQAPPAAHAAARPSRHGFALVYGLLGQQKDVAQLFLIKDARPELKELIEEIALVSGQGHERLEKLAEADPRLNLKDPGLPAAEVAARKAATDARTKQLLGASGKELELQLLLAQNEALGYLGHLTAVLARAEPDPERAEFLKALWKDLARVQKGVVGMLRAHYR